MFAIINQNLYFCSTISLLSFMTKKYEISFVVGPSHLDASGKLSIRSLIDMMQDCSIFQLDSEPQLAAFFKETNSGMFLSQRQIELKRLPEHGEKVRVVTWVYKCNPMYGFRNTNMYDERGEVCVCSSAIGVFVDYASGGLIRIPQPILDSVPIYEAYPMEYLPRKVTIPKEIEPQVSEPFFVWHFLIDANNHVNNARYVSVAQEYLPEDFCFDRIRVEYLVPAKQGSFMYPKCFEVENGYVVCLDDESGKHYSVVEFTRA